jgi:hypothetical protein
MIALFKIISIIIASAIALLDGFFDFRQKNKITNLGIGALILMIISALTAISLEVVQRQQESHRAQEEFRKEKAKDSAEIERYTVNIKKIDSIITVLNLANINVNNAYIKINKQELVNRKYHSENISNLFGIIDNLNEQAIYQKKTFDENLENMSKITDNLNSISQKVEMENFPFVPLRISIIVHISYNVSPFKNNSQFLSKNGWDEWFSFHNELGQIDYGFFGFPKFINEDQVIDELIRAFSLEIEFKQGLSTLIKYPQLEGKHKFVRDGVIIVQTNEDDDYSLTFFNSNQRKEILCKISYRINNIPSSDILCQCKSITDLKNSNIHLEYEIDNPNSNNFFVKNDVNYTDVKNYKNGTTETIRSRKVKEQLKIDVTEIYFDSTMRLEFGKKLTSATQINILTSSKNFVSDKFTWKCEGDYIFK